MKTTELKSNLHQIIDNIEDNTVLKAVYAILSKLTGKREESMWDAFTEEQKEVIEEGLSQLDKGEVTPHAEALKQIRQQFNIA